MARNGTCVVIAFLAAFGARASTFGDAGIAIPPIYIPGGDAYPAAVRVQGDGKLIVAGTAQGPVPQTMFAARFTAAGALDTTYGVAGRAFVPLPDDSGFMTGSAAVLNANGNLLIAGTVELVPPPAFVGVPRIAVARLTPAGVPDSTFGVNGVQVIDLPGYDGSTNALAMDSLGRIVIAGTANNGQHLAFAVVRLTPAGLLDTSFNGTGYRVIQFSNATFSPTSMAIDASNNIVLIGIGDQNQLSTPVSLLRLTPSGQFDPSFNGTGVIWLPLAAGPIAIDSNGGILLASSAYSLGTTTFSITRFAASGAIDASFGNGGSAQIASPPQLTSVSSAALSLDSQHRLVLEFFGFDLQQVPYLVLARFVATGILDASFNGSGSLVSTIPVTGVAGPTPVALDAGDNLLVAGNQFETPNGPSDVVITRLTSAGAMDPSFNGTGQVIQNCGLKEIAVNAMLRQPDGKFVVAGKAGANLQIPPSDFLVARLTQSGALDPAFNGIGYQLIDLSPSGFDMASAVALDGSGDIVVAGQDGTANFGVVRLTSAGALDATFNGTGKRIIGGPATGNGGARGVTIDAGGNVLLAGPAASGSGFQVVRLTPAGALDGSFASGGIGSYAIGSDPRTYPAGIAIDSGGKIVVGGSTPNIGYFCFDLAVLRLTAAGALDPTFAGTGIATVPFTYDCLSDVNGFALDGADRVVLAGTNGSGPSEPIVVRLASSGVLDATFNGNGINHTPPFTTALSVSAAAIDSAGSILAVGQSVRDMGLLKIASDGTIDQSFNAGQVMGISPTTAALDSFGTAIALESPVGIYLAGNWGRAIAVVKLFQSTPTAVEIASLDLARTLIANKPFDVLVQARDEFGNPQFVQAATTVMLSLKAGAGALGGNLSCVIPAGTTTCWITGVTYSKAESNVVLTASAIAGDALGPSDSGLFDVHVASSTTEVTSDVNPSVEGQPVTFTATVTAIQPTGSVAFSINSAVYGPCASVPLAGSGSVRTATCTTSALQLGWNNVAAAYSGDGNTYSSGGGLVQNVNPNTVNVASFQAGGSVTASSTAGPLFPASAINNGDRAGQNFGAGGVWADGTPGVFPDTVQINFVGMPTIDRVIVYSVQDNNLNPVEPSDTLIFTQRGLTSFDVQAWNGSAWLTLGSVTGNNLVKRTVTFAATATTAIRVVIHAVAGRNRRPNSYVAEIEAWTPKLYTPPTSTTVLASSINPANAGQLLSLTATVTGVNPTGPVAFTSNGVAIPGCGAVPLSGSGNSKTAVCQTSFASKGTFSIVATYAGDAGNLASASTALAQGIRKPRG